MFKKDIQLNFIERVKARIQSEALLYLKKERKSLIHRFICFAGGLFSGSFIAAFLIKNFPQGPAANDLGLEVLFIPAFFLLLGLGIFKFKVLAKNTQQQKNFPIATDFQFGKKDINFFNLTTQEINELFSLNLNPEQLNYLNDAILKYQKIDWQDLERLSSILSDEEKTYFKEKQQQQQLLEKEQTLHAFFSEHDLSNQHNAQLLTQQLKGQVDIEKETKESNLSSRL